MIKRIAFAGTPDFAAYHLNALIDAGFDVACVLTQPDRPAGRGRQLQASPVKQIADKHAIPVLQPESLKREIEYHEKLKSFNVDLLIVVAYGLILPEAFLNIPKYNSWNVHASLLPRWRGAAPIQRAIIAGDKKTGVTIMQMDAGLDTGDMLLKAECEIDTKDTGSSLHDKLAMLGAKTLIHALSRAETLVAEKQNNAQANYASKLSKAEAKIDWSESGELIERKVRAFNGWPIAFTTLGALNVRVWAAVFSTAQSNAVPGEVLAIDAGGIHVACADGKLILTVVQLPGKKAMRVKAILNGHGLPFKVGDSFV